MRLCKGRAIGTIPVGTFVHVSCCCGCGGRASCGCDRCRGCEHASRRPYSRLCAACRLHPRCRAGCLRFPRQRARPGRYTCRGASPCGVTARGCGLSATASIRAWSGCGRDCSPSVCRPAACCRGGARARHGGRRRGRCRLTGRGSPSVGRRRRRLGSERAAGRLLNPRTPPGTPKTGRRHRHHREVRLSFLYSSGTALGKRSRIG